MENKIIQLLKNKQIRIDQRKTELEKDKKLNQFLELLIQYPEALHLLYKLKDKRYPLIVPLQKDINIKNVKSHLQNKVIGYFYIRECVFEFLDQYSYFINNQKEFTRVVEFLRKCVEQSILIEKPEKIYYCQNCNNFILTTKPVEICKCGNNFDIILSLTGFTESVIKSMKMGHLLELIIMKMLRNYSNNIKLVGYETDSITVFTSIQYTDVGSGEKNNAEFDIIGVSDNILILIECKFNKTRYHDIKEFLASAGNLYLEVKRKFENVKALKVIISYDDCLLEYHNDAVVFSISKGGIKEFPKFLNSKLSIIKNKNP